MGGFVNVPHCPGAAVLVQVAVHVTPPPFGSFETVAMTFAVPPVCMLPGSPVITMDVAVEGLTVMVALTFWLVSARGVAWKVTLKLDVTVDGAV